MTCALEPCNNRDCPVCSVDRRFRSSALSMQLAFDLDRTIAAMTDIERADYYAKRRTAKGGKPRGPTARDMRDQSPTLAGERKRKGTSSKSRKGPLR